MRRIFIPLAGALTLGSVSGLASAAFLDYSEQLGEQISDLQDQTDRLEKKVAGLSTEHDSAIKSSQSLNLFRFGTAPTYGVGTSFDGSDLVINQASIAKDTQALKQEQAIENKHGNDDLNVGPRVEISGMVESSVSSRSPRDNNIGFSGTELAFLAQVNPWASGYTSLLYDQTLIQHFTLNLGFVTLGNLNQTPFYATLGRIYVPFGTYSSNMVTEPLTRDLGRSKENAIKLGYADGAWDASIFGYRGSPTHLNTTAVDQWGGKLAYAHRQVAPRQGLGFEANASYINNLADSDYLSNTIGNSVSGATLGQLTHYIPALDVFGRVNEGPFFLSGEYLTALRHFDDSDFTYNGAATKPQAWNVEAGVNFNMFATDCTWAVGYGKSRQALLYGVADHRYSTALTVAWLKNTVVGFEYARSYGYRETDVSQITLSDGTTFNQTQLLSSLMPSPGRISNSLTLQVDVYF